MKKGTEINLDIAYGLVDLRMISRILQGHPFGNLAKLVVDQAVKKKIDVLAITSAREGLITGIHDRFETLFKKASRLDQNKYFTYRGGHNSFFVKKPFHNRVCVVKSQQVLTSYRGKRTDIWTVGRDYIDCNPKDLPKLEMVLESCRDSELVFTKPSGHYGLSERETEKLAEYFDGMLVTAEAGKQKNKETYEQLEEMHSRGIGLRAVPVSAAHQIGGIGRAHTTVSVPSNSLHTEEKMISSIKKRLRAGELSFPSGGIDYPGEFYDKHWKAVLSFLVAYEKLVKYIKKK